MTRTLGEDVKEEDLKEEDLAFKRFFNIRYPPRSISRGINAQQPKPPRGARESGVFQHGLPQAVRPWLSEDRSACYRRKRSKHTRGFYRARVKK
jgi:hypothetical protein